MVTVSVSTWETDGYLIAPGILDTVELEALRAEAMRLAALVSSDRSLAAGSRYIAFESERAGYELSGSRHEEQVRMIEPLVDLSPPFEELSRRPGVIEYAREVLGGDVRLFEDKLNFKLPGGAGFVWHQDWSCCWRAHTDDLATCFIYLDDSTEANGCLQVLPGSHAGRRVRPFTPGSTFAVGLEVDEAERVLPLPLAAGDMVVFDPYLLHYSEPNRSDMPRRAIVYTYNNARHGDLWQVRYSDLSRPG